MNRRIVATLAGMLCLAGIAATGPAGAEPPPWAPAHGYRAHHRYIYYPAHRIWFEPEQRIWFWYDGGDWRFGASLPVYYRQYTSGGVVVELDSDRPYEHQAEVERRYGGPKHRKKTHPH